jgi:hypothetical protein
MRRVSRRDLLAGSAGRGRRENSPRSRAHLPRRPRVRFEYKSEHPRPAAAYANCEREAGCKSGCNLSKTTRYPDAQEWLEKAISAPMHSPFAVLITRRSRVRIPPRYAKKPRAGFFRGKCTAGPLEFVPIRGAERPGRGVELVLHRQDRNADPRGQGIDAHPTVTPGPMTAGSPRRASTVARTSGALPPKLAITGQRGEVPQ